MQTFVPVADAYVSAAALHSPLGDYPYLSVQESPAHEAYLEFQLSGLGGPPASAKLRLYATASSPSGGVVAGMSSTGWTEAVTYAGRPAIDGAVVATLGPVAAGQWYEVDVTGAVAGDGALSLGLTAAGAGQATYAAREDAAHAPQLVVTPAVPPPGEAEAPAEAALKDTAYPVPAGALFVDPARGSDAGAGTEAAPLRTLARAVAAAPAGGTVVLRGGAYREAVRWGGKRLALQPYPHEQAWLEGTVPVAGWVADGAAWRHDGWAVRFAPDADPANVDPAYPMAPYPDMVFLDGRPLAQAASLAALRPGAFFVDYAAARLYLGEDPAGKLVEAAALAVALDLGSGTDGSAVRGLGVRRYAPHLASDQGCMVRAGAPGLVFEDNTLARSAAGGLCLYSAAGAVVRGNTLAYNGWIGLTGYQADRLLLEGNRVAYNNQERFAQAWSAGGVKLAGSSYMTWRDNVAEGNIGRGLWCDWGCVGNTLVRNVVRGNTDIGILYEKSGAALIASNLVQGNGAGRGRAGIMIHGSQDVRVYNNTLARNGAGVQVVDDGRDVTGIAGVSGHAANVAVANNLLANNDGGGGPLLDAEDYSHLRTGAQMAAADYNGYWRAATAPAYPFGWGAGPAGLRWYRTFADFRGATGQEAHGLMVDNTAADPFFTDEAGGDYRLRAGSPALGAGQPLPADAAAAIGVAAGVPVDLGALRYPTP